MASRSWSKNRPSAVEIYHKNYLDSSGDTSYYVLGYHAKAFGGATWVRTPNWKAVQKSGDLPMNAYQFHKVHAATGGNESIRVIGINIATGQIVADYEDGNVGSTWDPLPGNTDVLDSTRATNIARNKVLGKIKNQSINLGQVYAERQQTVLLVEKTVQRVVRTVRYLRSANWNAAANEVGVGSSRGKHSAYSKRHSKDPQQAIADGWLELQYGWRPLLQDVYGAIEFVNNKQNRVLRQRVSASYSDDDTWGTATTDDGLFTTSIKQKRKCSVKFTLYYAVPNEFLKTLSEGGITNPALVAWELLPWSFVVDWFLPIGNFISSWDAVAGLQYQKGAKTTCWENFQDGTKAGRTLTLNNGQTILKTESSQWLTYHSVHIQRAPQGSFPPPALPEFKNPVSPEHMANLLALLISTFGRK
jgi:hypothetical protein